ncbi:MAG: hypothetical protein ACK5RO_01330 [Pseudobdellovibrionaceae bacterium]
MNSSLAHPPQLIPSSQCVARLDFKPLSPWPEGLPGVSFQKVQIAGFRSDLVFNYESGEDSSTELLSLFKSLYPELSFAEFASLAHAVESSRLPFSFPFEALAPQRGWNPNESFWKILKTTQKQPSGFLHWCAEKKMGPMDCSPLLVSQDLNLNPLLHFIVNYGLSKSQGAQVLEMVIELLLLGKTYEDLRLPEVQSRDQVEAWIHSLREIRYPQTQARDREAQAYFKSLPWPGSSQTRWVRQGDKSGLEIKLFVSQPSDLKRYLQSLSKVQEQLEKQDLN